MTGEYDTVSRKGTDDAGASSAEVAHAPSTPLWPCRAPDDVWRTSNVQPDEADVNSCIDCGPPPRGGCRDRRRMREKPALPTAGSPPLATID